MDDISYLAYNILCPLEENCGTPMVFQNTFSYVGSLCWIAALQEIDFLAGIQYQPQLPYV